MESDHLGLDLAILDIHFVSAKHNGDRGSADTDDISVPVGDILVGHTGSNIKHDDSALTLDARKARLAHLNSCEMKILSSKHTSRHHGVHQTSLGQRYPTH